MYLEAVARLVAEVYASHTGLAKRAAELAELAEAAGDQPTADLAALVIAELDCRAGRVPEGVARARLILDNSGDRLVRAHANAVIAGGLWRVGDNGTAVRHALRAHRMLVPGDPAPLRADHANILALQVNDRRPGELSHTEFEVAQVLAEAPGVPPALALANLNNWAWCSYLAGDLGRAAELADRLRAHSAATGAPLNASAADTVARVLLENGRSAEAVDVIEYAIEDAEVTDSDAVASALVTLAEIHKRGGDYVVALATLERCRRLAARDNLPEVDAQALRMIADCHAGLGDFRAAYATMVEFHVAWTERRSQESDVAARVAQAQFAVDEAHRDSDRFREMAESDSLTGLWNRRRCDAELAALREPASVALLDLDHFKQINDSFSHAVGDEVLRRVADLLRRADGRAGRYGGEEFLLILPAGAQGRVEAEAVRRRIEAYVWDAVAPGVRVTTSAGLTGLRPGDDVAEALARADELLYVAKRGGRNRVVADAN